MSNVFAGRRDLEVLHVTFQHFDLDAWQSEHRSVIVDELADERGGAPQALRLFLDYRYLGGVTGVA